MEKRKNSQASGLIVAFLLLVCIVLIIIEVFGNLQAEMAGDAMGLLL